MDDDAKELVVAYARISNNIAKAQYSSYDVECFSTMWAIAHFLCYLFGNKFLMGIDQSDKLTVKFARQVVML